MRKLLVLSLALCLVSLFTVPALAEDVVGNTTAASQVSIVVGNINTATSGDATAIGNASETSVTASMDISAAGISDAGDVIDDPEIEIDIDTDGDADAYVEYAYAEQDSPEIDNTTIDVCTAAIAIRDLNMICTTIDADIDVTADGDACAGIGVASARDVSVLLPL
ncbi:MAG: hypothetical protein AB1466_04555 [Actinomycetota bacterium]